jgi:hypothetical protein
MMVEAILKPLKVNLPQDGGCVVLRPGLPADLPPRIAAKLLLRAQGKVRIKVLPTADWLTLWRFVAEVSNGLEPTDPRLPVVLAAFKECDAAFSGDSKREFLVAIEHLVKSMQMHP